MTDEQKIENLAQQIYVARNNEKNSVVGSERTDWLDTTVMWVNQFLPELEKEADWNWSRENDHSIGLAVHGPSPQTIALSQDIRKLAVDDDRPVYLVKNGQVIATFDMVTPSLIKDVKNRQNEDRATVIGRKLVFSRPFTGSEDGADILVDVIKRLPALAMNNTDVLDIVDPLQLIVLGVLKNQTLPDIVQGGLSPSFAQKYADLLDAIKFENSDSTQTETVSGDDLGYIQGVW